MGTKGVFTVLLLILGVAFSAPASPECRAGTAQPSVRVLVTKLERAFDEEDAAAVAALAGCPFSVGQPESDNLSYVPPAVFAQRFIDIDEVKVLDLTLKKSDVASTYPREPRRIFLWLSRERKRATLLVNLRLNADSRHRHVFSFERDADGWRFEGYSAHDDGLLERLRRGYPNLLVQVKVLQFAEYPVK